MAPFLDSKNTTPKNNFSVNPVFDDVIFLGKTLSIGISEDVPSTHCFVFLGD